MSTRKLSTTPKKLGSGNLPSGYDEIIFMLADGDWIKNINLPLKPIDKCRVIIKSSATTTAILYAEHVDVPMESLHITKGSSYTFQYNSVTQKWKLSGTDVKYLTPNDTGDTLPDNATGILFYLMEDGNWTKEVNLPKNATEGTFVVIRSNASYKSKVHPTNMLYANTTTIMKKDEYAFKYLSAFKKWVVDKSPVRELMAGSIELQIPYPSAQRTEVRFVNGDWIPKIKLPESAGDRDKVSLWSNATLETVIDASNINVSGDLILYDGQYDFFYIAENKKWELIKAPDKIYQAQDISNGKIPRLTTPRTIVTVTKNNFTSPIELPVDQSPGTRVVISNSATNTLTLNASGTSHYVYTDEIVAFKVDEKTLWKRETITIDLLLLYSDKAGAQLGDTVMRSRLIEGLKLTNEALENSGANFRFRKCDIKKVIAKESWTSLSGPVSDLRTDPTVQGWRNAVKADGVYYEGTEDGCGLAWVKANSFNMVATGSTKCGTTVMRHELGHCMGVKHGGDSSSYNQGYKILKTIMGGNAIPYYSTPKRYTEDYGIPMGIVDKIDAVRAMNEFSAVVAGHR